MYKYKVRVGETIVQAGEFEELWQLEWFIKVMSWFARFVFWLYRIDAGAIDD